jgi:DNA (cytosine-5)-methyltransferase 1
VKTIPAIDLFAGPGGLAEGFSNFNKSSSRFEIRLSIEKDEAACRTLLLRAFVRAFNGRRLPHDYYRYIQGDSSLLKTLTRLPEWQKAKSHVKRWNLGEKNPAAAGYVSTTELHQTIHAAISTASNWVLLGGPPCQAYSLIGRARMTGIGHEARNWKKKEIKKLRNRREAKFANDHRHKLYREYLRVVAVHQPPFFVMENVKGILSSRLTKTERSETDLVFDRIRNDLSDPWRALTGDPDKRALNKLRKQFGIAKNGYRLHSFVVKRETQTQDLSNSDFLIRAEAFGIPQKRHRVIILGIRSDLDYVPTPLKPWDKKVTVRNAISDFPKIRSALSSDRRTRRKYGSDSGEAWCNARKQEIAPALLKIKDKKTSEIIRKTTRRKSTNLDVGGEYILQKTPPLGKAPSKLRRWMADRRLKGVIQHQSRSHMAADLARYLYLSASAKRARPEQQISPTLRTWPAKLLPKHSNVGNKGRSRHVGGFADRFRVQVWDRPATTVTSHIHKDGHYFIHPDPKQCRSLTVREAARLQTFSESYFFEGNKTDQFTQVGNAVPPFLAFQLAERVAALFSSSRRTRR